ncbi:CheY subfamily [Synechocystis sp. PCC 6803]|uniref:CheY subfamily n=1 Tax=Synechocystis sp. (strain ATCC 27184 / PCC 6803 / Kazusa) TaxID=1111708 RepID=P73243_SYNY3|nr:MULTISPECIES: response regulator [unclassified Synechocystis]MBD2617362.1 response regulator [Synechocystis sp. FACHB-898]MBD2639794.1 response regulator [Synechocystis sp. FACHB-908]MBD2659915.1 response regulator [Synechocystis sp. FACHB-929]BAM50991.1 chemotaxis protein CheY [Synechocystis sp. PCC 6803] [Bacillus subtilis BEST7613]AGF50959.1 CheY subfamily [Synechocystis sp. PCC 6803]
MSAHKILVIDDSKVIRMRVKDMLPQGNFEVIEAKDGLEGFNLIQSERPNLIMLDFLLPKMSGWEVFQSVQERPELKAIPLVLMSGRKEEVLEKIPEPFEYFAFVEKPFEQRELVAAIKEAMIKAKKHAPVAAVASGAAPAGDLAAEVQQLKQQVAQMHGEIDLLKKQLGQLVTFIKQRLS